MNAMSIFMILDGRYVGKYAVCKLLKYYIISNERKFLIMLLYVVDQ